MVRCSSANSGYSSLIASFILALLLSRFPLTSGEDFPTPPGVSNSPDAVSQSNVASNFLSWLQQAGFTDVFRSDRKVAVHISDDRASGERGLVAVRIIRSGEKMARIPLSAALTLNPAEDPEPYPDAGWALALASKLLREAAKVCFCAPPPPLGCPPAHSHYLLLWKGVSSRWHPYLASFPHHHPIPWLHLGEMQLPELQYLPTQRRIAAFQVEVQEAWLRSEQAVVGNVSWGEFAWAVNAVWTGAVSLKVPPGSEWRHMFLPVADLVNHSHEPNTFWLDRAITAEHLDLVASKDIPSGTPLLAHYGAMTSEAMFMMYGFVPTDNPEDTTVLFSSLSEAVAWYRERYLRNGTEAELQQLLEVARKGAVREMKHVGRRVDLQRLDPHPDSVDAHDNTHGGALVLYRHAVVSTHRSRAFCLMPAWRYGGVAVVQVDSRLIGATAMLERERTRAFWEAGEDEWRVDVDAAFDVVSRRAAEMLTDFPTTVADDQRILRDCVGGSGSCTLSPSMALAVQFRTLKKLMLQGLVDAHPPIAIHTPLSHLTDHSEL